MVTTYIPVIVEKCKNALAQPYANESKTMAHIMRRKNSESINRKKLVKITPMTR